MASSLDTLTSNLVGVTETFPQSAIVKKGLNLFLYVKITLPIESVEIAQNTPQ